MWKLHITVCNHRPKKQVNYISSASWTSIFVLMDLMVAISNPLLIGCNYFAKLMFWDIIFAVVLSRAPTIFFQAPIPHLSHLLGVPKLVMVHLETIVFHLSASRCLALIYLQVRGPFSLWSAWFAFWRLFQTVFRDSEMLMCRNKKCIFVLHWVS